LTITAAIESENKSDNSSENEAPLDASGAAKTKVTTAAKTKAKTAAKTKAKTAAKTKAKRLDLGSTPAGKVRGQEQGQGQEQSDRVPLVRG
jgi:hypothetical protein